MRLFTSLRLPWHQSRGFRGFAQKVQCLIPRDQQGAVMVEYVVLVGVVGIAIAATVAAFGPPLFESYRITRYILLLPVP